MVSIVKQFRSFDNIAAVRVMYLRADQRLAADFVVECNRTDDAVLLSQLHRYASVFVNSMQAVNADIGVEWREFLHELINSVAEGDYPDTYNPGWYESVWQQIAFDRIGEWVKFESIGPLILTGIREIVEINRFASECKNIPAVGKMLPSITRDIVERDDVTFNVVHWLALAEIYTRRYQGRELYKQPRYAQLVSHLAKYRNTKRDILFVEKLPLDKSNHKRYVSYFLKRVQNKDLHLAATFLCDNFNAVYEFYRLHDLDLVCAHFRYALGLAAMLQTGEKEMAENKQPKPSKRDDIGRQIEELNENIRQLNAEWEQMREAAAKLRATIAKSKKLIADWEC